MTVRYCTEFSGEVLNEPIAQAELLKGAKVVARRDPSNVVALIGRDELRKLRAASTPSSTPPDQETP